MASIKKIASLCNVSSATVSRVLNQDSTLSVSEDVRKKILDTAASLDYKTPRQKRNDRKLNISIALSPFDKPGFEERVTSMLQDLAPSFINVSLYNRSENTDGIIAIGEFSRDEVKDFESRSSNLLLINNLGTSYAHDSIMMDYAESEERVVSLFIEKGCRKIAYLGGTFQRAGHTIGVNRAEQFRKLLQDHSLFDRELFHLSHMDEESGYSAIKALDEIPDGIIFSDPDFARGAFRALAEYGRKVMCVTYANFFIEDVEQGYVLQIFPAEIFRTAFNLLTEKIRGERLHSYSIYAPSALVETNTLSKGQEE